MLNSKNSKESLGFLVPHIDYIMFLDPDDYWREDCVELCLKAFADSKAQGKQAEIVWFDNDVFYENPAYRTTGLNAFEKFLEITQDTIITPKIWAETCIKLDMPMAFATCGMIDFSFLTSIGIYFLNGATHEDLSFGVILFMHATHIAILNKKLYVYRIRDDSTTIFRKTSNISVPPFLQDLEEVFHSAHTARKYNIQESAFHMTFEIISMLDKPQHKQARDFFLKNICCWSLSIFCFDKDPHNIKQKLPKLKPYVKDLHLGRLNCLKHLVISYPKLGFVYAWTQKLKYGGGKKWLEKL
ncbi:hypothetical protein [Helicobacter sp. 10-6591]|uniref:hypothetical protein n=1 Tax=Helicobacter sp. 10-6591 TaxID=2004998 RepID=UPI0011BE7230|nr:hypothetical protein [Helicobacter sp. 10-6591]